jgi:DNA polymerase sigma
MILANPPLDMISNPLFRAKLEVLERMRVTVQSLWPRAQVKAFGSFVSGLGLPRCDLDMVICLPKVHREAGPEAPGILEGRNAVKESWQQNLSRCLCREDWVDANSIKVIGNTAIPVLKVRTRAQPARDLAEDDSVSLDVSFEGPGHRGLEANKLTTTLMKAHAALRPLLLVLKSFLARKALSESYTGGLSSYSLLLLLTRFLQETSGGGPSQEAGVEDLGALLIGFLRFYGERFDPRQTGVSVRSRCYFSRRETTSHPFVQSVAVPLTTDLDSDNNAVPDLDRRHSFQGGRPETPSSASGLFPFKFDPLYVEDPLEPRNNVARNCFRVSQVQKLWTEAACAIVSNLRSRLDDVTDHIKEGHLLEPLIGSE